MFDSPFVHPADQVFVGTKLGATIRTGARRGQYCDGGVGWKGGTAGSARPIRRRSRAGPRSGSARRRGTRGIRILHCAWSDPRPYPLRIPPFVAWHCWRKA